jgi:hypothetical protein
MAGRVAHTGLRDVASPGMATRTTAPLRIERSTAKLASLVA